MDEQIIKLLGGGRQAQAEAFRLIYQHYFPLFKRSLDAAESVLRQAFHEAVVELFLYLQAEHPPVTNLRHLLLKRARWCYLRLYRIDRKCIEFQPKHEVLDDPVELDESHVRAILRKAAEACRLIFDLVFWQEAAAWRVAEHFQLKDEKVAKDKIHRCLQEARSKMKMEG